MQTPFHPAAGHARPAPWRRPCQWLCLALLTTLSTGTAAQSAAHPSLVLVLNVFSDTHVKPVTGVVIAADGLVLVPAGFISEGDEIIVLDGGFNIDQNARRSRVIARSAESGLAVIAVDDLDRPPLAVTLDPAAGGAGLKLLSYPPAEQLADNPDLLTRDAGGGLPNLSGPLLNSCGQLAGLHMAVDPPGLDPVDNDRTVFSDELVAGLALLDIDTRQDRCQSRDPSSSSAAQANGGKPRGSELEVLDEQGRPVTTVEATSPSAMSPAKPGPSETPGTPEEVPETSPIDSGLGGSEAKAGTDSDTVPEMEPRTLPAPDAGKSLLWMAGMALAGILAAAWLILNIRRTGRKEETENVAPVAEPPAPLRLVVVVNAGDDANREERLELLSPDRPDWVIGALGADIEIDDASVRRRHALLSRVESGLAIGAADEKAGLWVNGLPCLPGEIMLIGPADEVTLGHVRCQFRLEVET